MIGASSLPGHTLIACHFPVVQLPAWQLPVQVLSRSAKRPSRLCSSGLTRAVSLPEQDTLVRDHSFTRGWRPFSSSYSSLCENQVEEEGTSDSSGKYESNSSPEEIGSSIKEGSCGAGNNLRSHNSFLPKPELDEEEEEDRDGDNLHKYHEDSSFALHGNSHWSLNHGGIDAFLHEELGVEWNNEGLMLGMGKNQEWLSNQMDSLHQRCHRCPVSRSLLSSSEQNSDILQQNIYGKCSPELLANIQTEDNTDSSCNSSDGILVNFCTIYNKSNNPATPQDLSSPAADSCQISGGSVFLSLQPAPQLAQKEDADPKPFGMDSNCNLYSLELMAPCLSSLEVTDLTACIQSQDRLAMETNQKYYKLVTCDLSSQSPSPACSGLTGCPGEPGRGCTIPVPPGSNKEGPPKENMEVGVEKASDQQVTTTSTNIAPCRKQHLHGTQSFSYMPCSPCCGQSSPHSSKCQERGAESTQPSVIQNREYTDADATEMGVWSCDKEMVRYSKLQRPTSLPIQPFVLLHTEKPQIQPGQCNLGGLLDQYLNHKSSKPNSSQNGVKFKEKRSQCLSELQTSPMESLCPVFLEAASSSDTCSTCTPSPKGLSYRHTWSQKYQPTANETSHEAVVQSQERIRLNPGTTSHQPNLVRIPTYQDLFSLQPEINQVTAQTKITNTDFHSKLSHMLPITPESVVSNLPVSLLPPKPSRPQLKLHQDQSLTAAACLSSLSSFLSSGLHQKKTEEPVRPSPMPTQSQSSQALIVSDRPPVEFCLSLDTSYESMSISHLQRKGLLRAVSNAVDLIMAHFGSSRDPEEKMRLGNSSYSSTIAGLVLEHLCPAIQNILEDGLRDHKLDFIIGQRRNHSWNVVDISTRIGPSTKVLYSLVSKIKQCPQLTSHSMRLRAFLMGLLNLRALEFWLSHLQSQKDVVTTYYHTWGFLFTSLSRCQPLFQELLLLLQPLSVLPFDLNLLLEPRLLCHTQLCSEECDALPPQPCSALLVTSWPKLQVDRKVEDSRRNSQTHQRQQEFLSSQSSSGCKQNYEAMQTNRSPLLASAPVHSVSKVANCSLDHRGTMLKIYEEGWKNEREVKKDNGSQNATSSDRVETPFQNSLRWAKLFGAAGVSARAEKSFQSHSKAQRQRLPSQWLHLDRSQIGLLAQSIRSIKLG